MPAERLSLAFASVRSDDGFFVFGRTILAEPLMSGTFYITTPIYYPNAEPHLGHVYTTLCADAVARYHRLSGHDTFFLTGTDEHGIKMVKTAAEQGIEPRALADRNVAVFENLWKELKVGNDGFIRTTSDIHRAGVQEIVRRLVATGDIYLGGYEGWYDEGQEEFVTETEAKTAEYKSVISGRPLVRYKEPSYFFRLSRYAPRVLEYIHEHPEFIQPESRRNEVISKLKQGVEDLSISRATLKWGIPLPHDPAHVVYVWIDALSNYITALGFGTGNDSLFKKFWPADVHLIGKEIMWFHTVYWPAMLFALDLPVPKKVFAHGWWTAEGRKMSKSLGNFIDLAKLRSGIVSYGLDSLRYYLIRAAPFGSDLDWKDADYHAAINELANVVGNLLNRVLSMLKPYDGVLPAVTNEVEQIDRDLRARMDALPGQLADAYGNLELQQCALLPVELARAANGFIDATAPFKLKAVEQRPRKDSILNLAAQVCKTSLAALLPVLPEKAAAGLAQLGVDASKRPLADLLQTDLPAGYKLGTGSPLFPKVEAPKL
jgi:methionyl-tRNA synthetase